MIAKFLCSRRRVEGGRRRGPFAYVVELLSPMFGGITLRSTDEHELALFEEGHVYEVEFRPATKAPRVQTLALHIGPVSQQRLTPFEGSDLVMILTDTQQVRLQIQPLNAKGKPAPVDGVPQWSSSNPGVATVEPDATGLSALVKAVAGGVTQISVVADADMDVGEIREITGVLDVEVKPGEAVTLTIAPGTPEEQP